MENQKKQSALHNFYQESPHTRVSKVETFVGLSINHVQTLLDFQGHAFQTFNLMSENVISTLPTPLSIATNFIINRRELLVPMVTEEPSVVAAASHGAKRARQAGGFTVTWSEPLMEGLIQVVNVPDINAAVAAIMAHNKLLLECANQKDPMLVSKGGGAQDIKCVELQTTRGTMLIVTLTVDVRDAMGANIVNTMAEGIAPMIAQLSKGTVRMAVISNYSIQRIAKASARWSIAELGQNVIDALLDAHAFACADIRRAATHNKGIMNGVEAVARATGNDTRALEAAAHSYAARSGTYMPLSHYQQEPNGDLVGTLELPIPVGIVGGSTQINPIAKTSLAILQPTSAQELGGIMTAVGLAQNFAALRALVCEGIQQGHMHLHQRALKTVEHI
ncbi:MAG: hydroxymethylglutaryl-CoA reductase, degradative [Candidatus Babeliales bacterium]